MGQKKMAVLRDKSSEEMLEEIVKLKGELSKEKASIASGTRAEKPSKIRNTRRQIARLHTLLGEKHGGVKK